jgi:DNA-binding LacI/PurR family transcriptional regulator
MSCRTGLPLRQVYIDYPAPGLKRFEERKDQLAVAGFGDFEIAGAVHPSLTTVRTHGYQIGWNAADLLIARIEGRAPDMTFCDVGYDIVRRESA